MLGSHLIFSTYGFWLPNDPRGSGSRNVRAHHLYAVGGEATRVETTRSVAARPHDRILRNEAKQALKRPVVQFTGVQARAVGRGFARIAEKLNVEIRACSIMPDHVHLVALCHRLPPQELIEAFKRAGTRGLNLESLHPFRDCPRSNGKLPSPWAAGGWKVFLDTEAEVQRAIRYVEQNPIKAGLKRQCWSFVRS